MHMTLSPKRSGGRVHSQLQFKGNASRDPHVWGHGSLLVVERVTWLHSRVCVIITNVCTGWLERCEEQSTPISTLLRHIHLTLCGIRNTTYQCSSHLPTSSPPQRSKPWLVWLNMYMVIVDAITHNTMIMSEQQVYTAVRRPILSSN